MKIAQIQSFTNQNFKGKLQLTGLENNLFKEDYPAIKKLQTKIESKDYDLKMNLAPFGMYTAEVEHKNGNVVRFSPFTIPYRPNLIPNYIESLMDLIDINKTK